mgnify:CR=1 FL=1
MYMMKITIETLLNHFKIKFVNGHITEEQLHTLAHALQVQLPAKNRKKFLIKAWHKFRKHLDTFDTGVNHVNTAFDNQNLQSRSGTSIQTGTPEIQKIILPQGFNQPPPSDLFGSTKQFEELSRQISASKEDIHSKIRDFASAPSKKRVSNLENVIRLADAQARNLLGDNYDILVSDKSIPTKDIAGFKQLSKNTKNYLKYIRNEITESTFLNNQSKSLEKPQPQPADSEPEPYQPLHQEPTIDIVNKMDTNVPDTNLFNPPQRIPYDSDIIPTTDDDDDDVGF